MPRKPQEISAKVVEIYGLVRFSDTPISVLSMETMKRLRSREWSPLEVERVSSEVMSLLIRRGWSKSIEASAEKAMVSDR